jgi:hypothetical protein
MSLAYLELFAPVKEACHGKNRNKDVVILVLGCGMRVAE